MPPSHRLLSTTRLPALFAALASAGDDAVHVVRSTGTAAYANLAVEQRLLELAPPGSRVLLLYHNAPCVVIGRNQNPWAEVRLGGLAASGTALVRRRSGGGAVYHDAGNANWSVLFPAAGFDRDRHACMVARALQTLGAATARVNARHDIVVDGADGDVRKVSGSAYKLTRARALHHGTCLLGADLAAVAGLLRSPAAAYVRARGVASVRSPVRNIGALLGRDDGAALSAAFADAVAHEFEALYGPARHAVIDPDREAANGFDWDPPLARGYAELTSPDWLYGQTPQFTFSTAPTPDDPRERPPPPPGVPAAFSLSFTARHGRLEDVVLAGLPIVAAAAADQDAADQTAAAALDGRILYHIRDWHAVLTDAAGQLLDAAAAVAIGAWLDQLLGVDERAFR